MRVRIEHFRNPKDWILRIESIASARRVRFRQSTPFTRAFPKKRTLAGTRTKPNPRRRARALTPHRTPHARIPLPTSPCIIIRVPWALRARPRIGSSLSSSSPRGDCFVVVAAADAREEPPLSKMNHRRCRTFARLNLALEPPLVTCVRRRVRGARNERRGHKSKAVARGFPKRTRKTSFFPGIFRVFTKSTMVIL